MNNSAFASGRSVRASFAVPVVEALEGRRFLSAGDVDASFGRHGVVIDRQIGAIEGMALQPVARHPEAPKVVVTAGGQLLRYNLDGSRDGSFRAGWLPAGAYADVAVQADGKILLVGGFHGQKGSFVRRLNADGTADTTFGANHDGMTPFAPLAGHDDFYAAHVAVGPGGRIYVACYDIIHDAASYTTSRPAVVRLNADGTIDAGYGTNGMAAPPEPTDIRAWGQAAMVVRGDGSVVLAGGYDFWVPLGGATYTFSADGQTATYQLAPGAPGNDAPEWYNAAAALRNGQVAILSPFPRKLSVDGGSSFRGIDASWWVDASFGGGSAIPDALAVDADGKILVGTGGGAGFELLRLNADGTRDATFGLAGVSAFKVTGAGKKPISFIDGNVVLALPDGSILVGGSAYNDMFLTKIQGGADAPARPVPKVVDFSVDGPSEDPAYPGRVTVAFAAGTPIDTGSLDDGDLVVTGPHGYFAALKYERPTDAAGDATRLAGTYTMPAPKGGWDPTRNGVYTVSLRRRAVTNVDGQSAAGGVLGTFRVALDWPDVGSAPPGTVRYIDVQPTSTGRRVTFDIGYFDATRKIDPTTFGDDDVLVHAPDGSVFHPKFRDAEYSADDGSWFAEYTFDLPGGERPNLLHSRATGVGWYKIIGARIFTKRHHPLKVGDLGGFRVTAEGISYE